jgi:hypothetical protein
MKLEENIRKVLQDIRTGNFFFLAKTPLGHIQKEN